jgi:glucosylglycerate hydrolase
VDAEALRSAALAVLRTNDLGEWTKPAPRLYPHQWSWDSAFIAIGLAQVDLDRALRELETLFAAQWSDGRVPHIVFNPHAADYFPGAEWWASASTSRHAPRAPATSGLIQPPVHALALLHIYRRATRTHPPPAPAGGPPSRGPADAIDERVRQLYPRVLAWHRYLAAARDPHDDGLLVIYHPWESGTDNSPRWDAALGRVDVGDLPAYQRHDLKHVADPSERPTHAEYDRYLWLVELLKNAGYDDQAIQTSHPFLIGDVLMSAIFALACQQLAELGNLLSRPSGEVSELMGYARRFSDGIRRAWDVGLRLALDRDLRAAEWIRVETCAGLAPLMLPDLEPALLGHVVERLRGCDFAGADGLAFPVVPSTAPGSPGFAASSYWRGPVWPVANWLFWYGLQQHGQREPAANLRAANLALLAQPTAQFAEYFEPFTAEPLGSLEQSWTAAVALDWLSAEH